MKEPKESRRARCFAIEFFGIAGAGKSTICRTISEGWGAQFGCEHGCDQHNQGQFFFRSNRFFLSFEILLITLGIVAYGLAPARVRVDRALRFFRRCWFLIHSPTLSNPHLFSEGPLTWLLSEKLNSEQVVLKSIEKLFSVYERCNVCVVFIDSGSTIARERRQIRLGSRTNKRTPRESLKRASFALRERRFSSVTQTILPRWSGAASYRINRETTAGEIADLLVAVLGTKRNAETRNSDLDLIHLKILE
jgi:hypothetical protein